MRIAIYGRVSTSHQVEHQTIEQQLGRLGAPDRAGQARRCRVIQGGVEPQAGDAGHVTFA
ncbi:MAG: hypothetical protein ACRYHQ_20250 [Janthinobacterium lividum]